MNDDTARGAKPALTKDELDAILSYDADAGEFTRLVTRGKYKAGTKAGYVHRHLGYVEIKVNGQAYYAHRLAHLTMTGEWPSGQMDHRNHIKWDNRWSNLRPASRAQNVYNQKGWSSSGYKCIAVYETKSFGTRFAVKVQRGDTRYQNVFGDLDNAINYRDEVIRKHDGEFAQTGHRDD
ncbi:hypothetical protein GR702_11530 [Novosphingobium sp. FGD1]|uniref:HNH nuclease domain-containing protein n=1 Tax=Novosphingobium silvae TaxID=2692619 RepID=A0A7X4K7M6_9SPHN|nr:HNH endonuclease signature motif containing protein [Novosphingobium silvae]MYL98394.1 hypothetical protein [Novosphingobium silvae]